MRMCTWRGCREIATVAISGWLIVDPVPYCADDAGIFKDELRRMGWTFPIIEQPILQVGD